MYFPHVHHRSPDRSHIFEYSCYWDVRKCQEYEDFVCSCENSFPEKNFTVNFTLTNPPYDPKKINSKNWLSIWTYLIVLKKLKDCFKNDISFILCLCTISVMFISCSFSLKLLMYCHIALIILDSVFSRSSYLLYYN